jgi:2-C-methyl-D-erythritol 2,4-cyclodiphosphate synthase
VIAQAPKLASYLPAMIELMAADLGIEPARINLKAKTAERLGALGRQEGIVAQTVVLLAGPAA